MAWLTILDRQAITGTRSSDVPWPQNARYIETRASWDNESRLDQRRHISCRTYILSGSQLVRTAFTQVNIAASGAPDLPSPGDLDEEGNVIPDLFPGPGRPVPIPATWLPNKLFRFEMLQYQDNGGPPMNTGLQIRWFDAGLNELDSNGQVEV